MRQWLIRRKQAAYLRLAAEISAREAVHIAEEIVGEAWLSGLLEAEDQAAAAHRACEHIRDTAYAQYESARAARDSEHLGDTYRALAASQNALSRIQDRHDDLRRLAADERALWAEAVRARAQAIIDDQVRLAEAARAAGVWPRERL